MSTSVGVELNNPGLTSIKVYAATIQGYLQSETQCLLNLSDLGFTSGTVDQAEGIQAKV